MVDRLVLGAPAGEPGHPLPFGSMSRPRRRRELRTNGSSAHDSPPGERISTTSAAVGFHIAVRASRDEGAASRHAGSSGADSCRCCNGPALASEPDASGVRVVRAHGDRGIEPADAPRVGHPAPSWLLPVPDLVVAGRHRCARATRRSRRVDLGWPSPGDDRAHRASGSFASAQVVPQATLTSSGTSSSAASRMMSMTSGPTTSRSSSGTSTSTSSWTCSTSLAGHVARPQGIVDADERDLEDVGGEALDAGVHRLALARLADPEVGVGQLRDRPAAAEQRLGVAAHPRLDDRARPCTPSRSGTRRSTRRGSPPPPRSGCSAADRARTTPSRRPGRRHHLRLRALVERDGGRLDAEDPRRGGVVDVLRRS